MRRLLDVVAGVAIVGALASAPACTCSGEDTPKKKPPTSARRADRDERVPPRQRPAPSPKAAPDRLRPPRDAIRLNQPITIDDVRAAVADAFSGYRELTAPAEAPSGAQVRLTYCVSGTDITAAAEGVAGALRGAGWEHVTVRAPNAATTNPRSGIAGDKADLRVSVTVQSVRRTGCDSSLNQFFSIVSVNRISRADTERAE